MTTPGIHPKVSILYQRNTCTSVFIAALFTVAKKGSLPRQMNGEWKYGACTQWNLIQLSSDPIHILSSSSAIQSSL